MTAEWLGLLELLLVFGALVWFGVSQLRAVRRGRPRSDKRDEDSN